MMTNEIRIERAVKSDVPAIAAIFTECFEDSVLHHCGKIPKPQAMRDVFSLVWEAETDAALIARVEEGPVIGYCFAPTKLYRLWIKAITGGHLFIWLWHWLTGQYGFGIHPIKVIILNKVAFLLSSASPTTEANARILSIAVLPAWRGHGVAGKLMTEAIAYFREKRVNRVRLEVRPNNAPAIKVYKDKGFIEVGVTYDSQGPWLIMMKEME